MIGKAQAQQIDSLAADWSLVAELPATENNELSKGYAGAVTGCFQNLLFVAGGANFPKGMPWEGGKKRYYNSGVIYRINNQGLQLQPHRFQLPNNLAYPAVCSSNKGIFFAGGENENGPSNQAWLMNWDADLEKVNFIRLPDLPFALANAAATYAGHKIFMAGGETATEALTQFICLDLKNVGKGWQVLASVPHPVSHAVLVNMCVSNSRKIYLAGGRKKNSNGISEFYQNVYKYQVDKNTWEEVAPLPYPLAAGTGAVLGKHQILLFGGDKGIRFHETELLISAIQKETDETKKQALIQEKNKLQVTHPGFSNELLMYQPKTDRWQAVGHIPFTTPVTTTAVKYKNKYFLPSGEIKAGVRTPHILMFKILKP